MPLKHLTETLLVFFLGLVVALTGVFIPTLPPLPQGIGPWIILFLLTLAYPLALYPLLKRNRADYSFRVLHFLPAMMAGIWLILQSSMLKAPSVDGAFRGYVYAWTLPAVAASFFLIVLFCLQVIRRRVPRLLLLTLLFMPFLALSLLSQRSFQGSRRIAAVLWRGTWWNITGTASSPTGGASSSAGSARSIPLILSGSTRSRPIAFLGSSSSRPTRLPSAGPEINMLVVGFLALYSGTLHRRALTRRS